LFNRVIGLGLDAPADEAAVAALTRIYRDAGARTWWLHWNPHAQPEAMLSHLVAAGFTAPPRRSWAKMLRGSDRAKPVATRLAIAPIRDVQAAAVAAAIAAAFGMPPFMSDWLRALHGRPRWRLYAVTDGVTIAGGGCLYTDGTSAWLGMGSVLEPYRRRGGQRALMARRIDDAIAGGARDIVTETGEAIGDEPNPSLANMAASGFERVASRLNFAGPPGTPPP
jgi:GNAT superfamily N-acetyltransferase